MSNRIKSFIENKKTKVVLVCIVALVFTLVFNPFSTQLLSFDIAEWRAYSPLMFISLGYAYLFWFFLICLAGVSRFFAYGVIPIASIIQFTLYYAGSRYGVNDIQELTYVAIDATWKEASVYINMRCFFLFVSFVIGVFVLGYILWFLSPLCRKWKNAVILLVVESFMLALPLVIKSFFPSVMKRISCQLVVMAPEEYKLMNYNMPDFINKMVYGDYDLFNDAYFPVQSSRQFVQGIWQLIFPEILVNATTQPSSQVTEELPQTVVLYIGESFRSDHSPFNGYHRNTTPKLLKEKDIINFPAVYSRKTSTLASIYSILTDTNPKTLQPDHGSFLSVIKKHGIKVSLLVSQKTSGKWYKFPTIYPLLNGYVDYINRPRTNEDFQIQMNKIQHASSPQFILIEDGTGHLPYIAFNQTFGSWDPRNMPIDDPAKLDCYDNCLIDTDARLHAIIDTLRDKDAILLYTSDHGESLGENGYYGHGGPVTIKEQTHVFAFIWYSDLYKKRRPDIVKALEQNASRFVSHDYIYHTIISMCGLASDVQRPEQNMTRPQPGELVAGQE